jgi:hypothetical protein
MRGFHCVLVVKSHGKITVGRADPLAATSIVDASNAALATSSIPEIIANWMRTLAASALTRVICARSGSSRQRDTAGCRLAQEMINCSQNRANRMRIRHDHGGPQQKVYVVKAAAGP